MGGDCSQKLLLRRGSHSSPGRSRSSESLLYRIIGCPRARRSGLLFSPTRGLCAFRRSVNIVSFETSSARLVFSPPLLSRGGVVPAGPPKWLPPWPPRLMPVPLSPRILLLQSSSQNMFACYIP